MPATPQFVADEAWRAGLENLRRDLAERGVSANELARLTGIARMTIFRMMAGERAGTVLAQGAIAEAMGNDPGRYFPRNERELRRAEALSLRENSGALAGELRAKANVLSRAATAIEELAS